MVDAVMIDCCGGFAECGRNSLLDRASCSRLARKQMVCSTKTPISSITPTYHPLIYCLEQDCLLCWLRYGLPRTKYVTCNKHN